MKMTRKEWIAYIAISAAMVGLVYAVSTDNLDLRILRAVSRISQRTARVFGEIGLETEHMYLSILESRRLV